MNEKITEEYIQQLRDISIHKILNLNNTGRTIMIRCPFHDDRSPSCAINSNNSFKCFGCGESGLGAIDFCMSMGLSFKESLEELKIYL